MNGVIGTRVIIVDDDEKDALPFLKELSRRGIPATYFDGTKRGLPLKNQRLSGVRLAILDMDLVGGGVSDKSKMSALMNYIKGILNPRNGPYGVIVWTGNAYLLQEFEEAIYADVDIPKPIFTITLDKQNFMVRGKFKLNILSEKIDNCLAQYSPLLLLQAWEEKCFIAATEVTNELASLVVQEAPSLQDWRNNWKTQFFKLMHAMAFAEAGKHLNKNTVLNSLYRSMNPLHADRMESNITGLHTFLSIHSGDILAAAHVVNLRAKAKINTMLHLALNGTNVFYAGNIYMRSKLKTSIPSVKTLLDDFVDGNNVDRKQIKSELSPLCKAVVIEINATCDHSQNNIRIARFIAGLIVPKDKSDKIIKRADFLYKLGPVFLESRGIPAGEYDFCFSARHLLTIELNQVKNISPFARLRGQAFGDLQSWFAHRSARPGMLLLP